MPSPEREQVVYLDTVTRGYLKETDSKNPPYRNSRSSSPLNRMTQYSGPSISKESASLYLTNCGSEVFKSAGFGTSEGQLHTTGCTGKKKGSELKNGHLLREMQN